MQARGIPTNVNKNSFHKCKRIALPFASVAGMKNIMNKTTAASAKNTIEKAISRKVGKKIFKISKKAAKEVKNRVTITPSLTIFSLFCFFKSIINFVYVWSSINFVYLQIILTARQFQFIYKQFLIKISSSITFAYILTEIKSKIVQLSKIL